MRELEFVPEWYPMLRRKWRFVWLEAWVVGSLLGLLGLWLFITHRNVSSAEAELAGYNVQIEQADSDLRHLGELQELKRELSQQAKVLAHLGMHVPAARIVDELDQLMPKNMGLLDLSLQTETRVPAGTALSTASGAAPALQRELNVRLHGVAPTDVDLGNFLARLASGPFFKNIAMSYSRDRVADGHDMREFELTFSIDLGAAGN